MNNSYKRLKNSKISNISITVMWAIIILFSFPSYKANIQPGLDPSWQFAINYFRNRYEWGSQVNFTFGPLGFLAYPQAIGNNLTISYIFWLTLFCFSCAGIAFLIRKNQKEASIFKMAASTILFLLAAWAFCQPEYYLIYIVLLYVSIAWFADQKIAAWVIANVVFCISFYLKLSAAIIIGSILFFMLIAFLINHKKVIGLIGIFLVSCFAILISLFFYTGSIPTAIRYIKTSLDLSTGYNIAMSINTFDMLAPISVCIIILYFILLAVFLKIHRDTGLYMFAFVGCIFFAFKHGFVRADAHILFFFSFMALLFSLQLLFTDFNSLHPVLDASNILKYYKKLLLILLIFFVGFFSVFSVQNPMAITLIKNKLLISTYFEEPGIVYSEKEILNEKIMNEVKNESVTIFPWEVSYVAYNNLNYVPMPIMQSYSAYTPYLDHLNSEFFLSENAPKYIIFNYDSIDGRHPLIDIPETWQVMNDNYEAIMAYDGVALLERTQRKYASAKSITNMETINQNQMISIPKSENLVTAKINMELSPAGKLAVFLYKVPEVYVEITGDKGLPYKYRIVPENLSNGVIVNKIPTRLEDTLFMLNTGKTYQNTEGIKLSGPGLKYYKKDIKIEFYELKPRNESKENMEGENQNKEI